MFKLPPTFLHPVLMFFIATGFVVQAQAVDSDSSANIPAELQQRLQEYQQINWQRYTVAEVRKRTPTRFHGNDVTLLPVQVASLLLQLPNIMEMQPVWEAAGMHEPDIIVIANGVYNLEQLHRLIADPTIFRRVSSDTYIAYRPIYLAASATLVVSGKALRLSLKHGAWFIYHGNIHLLDARLQTWDEQTANYGPREKIAEKELLLLGRTTPRPYLLGLNGSWIYAANTVFYGLGYKGQTSTFGLSLRNNESEIPVNMNLRSVINRRKHPSGLFIGNTISRLFFGFYSHGAHDIVFVGNVFHDNIIYNFDPHDYSTGLLIARNIFYHANHAHGIIVSRGVNDNIIAENLVFENQGAGLMLDRHSNNNLLIDNISLENGIDGIAIYESNNNLLLRNTVSRNANNGINIRNSCAVLVKNNTLFRNAHNGAELTARDIYYLETRDFVKDPYQQLARAHFQGNTFDSNLNSALAGKGGVGIHLWHNRFINTGPLVLSGELEPFTHQMLIENTNQGFEWSGDRSCP